MVEAVVTTSWDDGHPCDLRLAELLRAYDVPATFYVPVYNDERARMSPRQVREIARDFDVGGHSLHHVDLRRIPLAEAGKEIVEGKKVLEDMVGRELRCFCYPWGSFNDHIANIVRGAGFLGARTTKSLTRRMGEPFAMTATANATNWWFAPYVRHSLAARDLKFFIFMLRNNLLCRGWHRLATETLDFVVRNGGIWHLWGHSWEIDQNNDWGVLEELFREIGALPGEVRRLTNSQLLETLAGGG